MKDPNNNSDSQTLRLLDSTSKIRTFRDLKVWQKSMDLVEKIYKHTFSFPAEEKYGLTSQLRRAAVSIPSNIAEGGARNSTKEFIRFLSIANGSLMELQTQSLIAQRLNMLSKDNTESVIQHAEEISRMIAALSKKLEEKV